MNAPNISDPGKEYFLKIASKKWNFREAFTLYEHTLKLPFNIVCGIMESDLNLIIKSRKAFVEPSNAIFSDLQFYVKQMESQQPSQQHIIAGSINDNYNNCSNLTKNIYHTNSDRKRKNKDSDGIELDSSNSAASLLLNKVKKSYSFHPPNITPSISTNKPRINGDDAKKLNDYFVTVIGPHSGDETLNCTRQEYELNMEEQRVLYCFKKRASTFNLLNSCLNGTLDNLLDCMDNTKVNIGDNDDERQDIRLLHYILSDYHANCSKPSYVVIPNERTPFAEYIIPIFKYFSASTKLLSFIW
ncbi:hypothetical protein EDC96DRAFT_519891 [Choanephora cucurbitarum]|nr:hypothetical protein EDC96DRAFT_519891 [Choanephora cucurbitarum]